MKMKKMKRQIAVLIMCALLAGILPVANPAAGKAAAASALAGRTARAGYGLNNPRTNSDGGTTWDCVWFGNYWQEDTNGDGKADQNDAKQPIKWRVLSVNGDDAFLIADKNLDCQMYNDTDTSVTWETCTIRSWLNGYGTGANKEGKDYSSNNFLINAFAAGERSAIRTTNVVNNGNSDYDTEGGNDTSDQVYLLSLDEVKSPGYGFSSDYNKYDESRRAKNTGYAKERGAYTNTSTEYAGNGIWWLRSPGICSFSATSVNDLGSVYQDGPIVHGISVGVRPALHLNLSSTSSWSYAGTVTLEGEEKHFGLNNPSTDSDGVTTWDCVWFGNYWQEDTNGDGKADKNDAKQPIKWRVLSMNGDDAFLLADKNLDCKSYNFNSTLAATWKTCTMRSWLNGYGAGANNDRKDYGSNNFLVNAFSEDERSAARTTNVVNNDNPVYGTGGGNDTSDQVYLLSLDEVMNPGYGFLSASGEYVESRRAKNTGYAKEQGAYTNKSTEYAGNSYWWLRSPGKYNFSAALVSYDGSVDLIGPDVHYSYVGVRPALHLNLSSTSSWSYAGTVTSEGGGKEKPPTSGDEVVEDTPNQDIIDRVSEYTSDQIYAQFDQIKNSGYSEETKFRLYQALFRSYGITDVKEGIRYLSRTTDKRYAYLNLVTDEIYCASNFQYWLENTNKGTAAQAVLVVDGLLFNGEINDWLDFTTYAEQDFPGVSKYKDMLYDFMDTASDSIEIVNQIKLVSDLSKNVKGVAKRKADNLIDRLNKCSNAEEGYKLLESSTAKEVWIALAEEKDESGNFVRNENGSIKLTYKLDESSGFGQFAKAMGYATKIISCADLSLRDGMDLLALSNKLAIYAQYKRFLKDVVSQTGKIPFQLRWAASLILAELDSGYMGKISSIGMDILKETFINEEVLKNIVGKTASESLSSWLSVINIETFFINKITDIGNIVNNAASVKGYAKLSSAFAQNLERAKRAFLSDKTEENAWDFYYNYNILYRLRYKGEKAYLAMTKIKGYASCFSDFGYAQKEAVVKDTLSMLENQCRFTMDEAAPVPESCQFAEKFVIHCPVNVSVYAEDGTLIAELLDGTETDVTNEYGRFAVVNESYSGDYLKIICLNREDNVSIRMTGVDDGLVSMELAQAVGEESGTYVFDNVPVTSDAVITATVSQITQKQTYEVDVDGDGTAESEGNITIKENTYIPMESVSCSKETLQMKEGESETIQVTVLPENATKKEVLWMSADSSVAVVSGGKVTAVAKGNTRIYGMPVDNMEKMFVCEVLVIEDTNPTVQPTAKSTAPPTMKPTEKPIMPPFVSMPPISTLSPVVTPLPTLMPVKTSSPTMLPTLAPIKTPEVKATLPPVPVFPVESMMPEISPFPSVTPEPTATPAETPEKTVTPEATPTITMPPSLPPVETPEPTATPAETPEETVTPEATPSPLQSVRPTELPNGEAMVKPIENPAISPGAVTPLLPVSLPQLITPVIQPSSAGDIVSVKKVASIKLKRKKQTVTVSWKKVSGASGYQLCYSTSKKWKNRKLKLTRKTKLTVKKLKKKKTYYFRVRAYQMIDGRKVYSKWSSSKKIKIKK